MPDLHPVLSGFPLPLLGLAALLELLQVGARLGKRLDLSILILLGAASLSTIFAFFSGYGASEEANKTFEVTNEAISAHHLAGRWLMFLILPCFICRLFREKAKPNARITLTVTYWLLLPLSLGLVLYTGLLGGRLVFEHGAGVSASIPVKHETKN